VLTSSLISSQPSLNYSSLEARKVLTTLLPISHVISGNGLFLSTAAISLTHEIEINDVGNEIVVTETRPGGLIQDLTFPAAGIDRIRYIGNDNRDVVTSYTAIDTLMTGRGGDDTIYSGSENDRLVGEQGNDRLFGDDVLYGQAGNDELKGFRGDDRLIGGPGDDILDGGEQADILTVNSGRDEFITDNPLDVITDFNPTDDMQS